jgi:Nitric oxide reductase activation protein
MTPTEVTKAAKNVAKVLRKSMDDETPMEEEEGGGTETMPGGGGMSREGIEGLISEAMTFAESDNEEDSTKPKEESKDLDDFDYAEGVIDDKLNSCIFRNAVPNLTRYDDFLSSVKGDAQLLARTLHLRTFNESKTIKGMRSGRLDDNRIVEAVHGVKTVYTRHIERIDKKMNMVLLIDESGSMGDGVKDVNAAKSAILLEQCYKLFPMGQLFIYGFTSDLSDDEPYFNRIIRYKEGSFTVKGGLGDVRGRCNNRDGECIRAVANRVRTFTQEPMLYFVISDGQPAASGAYGGAAGIADTARAVKEVTAKKFFPIQIGIGVHESVQKMMFTDYVNYRDSRQMVEDLRKLLVKKAHKFIGI